MFPLTLTSDQTCIWEECDDFEITPQGPFCNECIEGYGSH